MANDCSANSLDQWILARLNELVAEVTAALDDYVAYRAAKPIEEFVDDLSNWYVRRSRRRYWKSEADADKQAAYSTLYEVLVTLSKLVAPVMPFTAEVMYQNLVRSVDPGAPDERAPLRLAGGADGAARPRPARQHGHRAHGGDPGPRHARRGQPEGAPAAGAGGGSGGARAARKPDADGGHWWTTS